MAMAQKGIGILLTIVAISLGAPFSFDVLNRVTVIRSAIKPAQSQFALISDQNR